LKELKRNIENDRIFGFNLSAFVTAARSVTFLMQKEFQHVAGFEDWYTNKQTELMQSDNEFKFFNELRVATVHTKALQPNKKVKESIVEPAISISDSVSVRVIRAGKVAEKYRAQDGNMVTQHISPSFKKTFEPFRLFGKKPARNVGSRSISRFFKERPNDDLVVLCEKYVGKLKKLVDECEQLFEGSGS
jgi:hypothetical protein